MVFVTTSNNGNIKQLLVMMVLTKACWLHNGILQILTAILLTMGLVATHSH